MRKFAAPSLEASFSDRVVAQALSGLPVSRISSRPLWLASAALLASAATALLVVSLVWYARSGSPAIANNPSRQISSGIAIDRPAPGGQGSNKRNRGSAPPGYGGGLALAQPGWLIEAPRLPGHLQSSIDSLPETLPETIDQLNQVEQLAPGIRPIRLSLSALWDALCHAFSGTNDEPEPPSRGRSTLWRLDKLQLA